MLLSSFFLNSRDARINCYPLSVSVGFWPICFVVPCTTILGRITNDKLADSSALDVMLYGLCRKSLTIIRVIVSNNRCHSNREGLGEALGYFLTWVQDTNTVVL